MNRPMKLPSRSKRNSTSPSHPTPSEVSLDLSISHHAPPKEASTTLTSSTMVNLAWLWVYVCEVIPCILFYLHFSPNRVIQVVACNVVSSFAWFRFTVTLLYCCILCHYLFVFSTGGGHWVVSNLGYYE